MNEPEFIINVPALIAAILTGFAIGGIWYGPLFGKKWASLMGMTSAPDKKQMKRALILQVIGLCLTAYVMTHVLQVWRPSVWHVGDDAPDYQYALMGSFFVWLGFYVPLQLGKVSWENRPWKLFLINSSHDFVLLMGISLVLSCWR